MSGYAVQVTLTKANDLPASDFGFMGMGGKSDPYFCFKVNGVSKYSEIVSNELNPVWKPAPTFTFQVDRPREAVLHVSAYDHDRFNSDDLLGMTGIALGIFLDTTRVEELSYELEVPDAFRKQNCKAVVFLEIKVACNDRVDAILELWENQQFDLINKWKEASGNRKRWSQVDNTDITSNSFAKVAPPVPPHMEAAGWTLNVSHGDEHGWVYAPSFSGPWQSQTFTLAMARRRKWINKCKPIAGTSF